MKAMKTHAGACGSWVLTVVGLLAAAAHGTALVHGHPDTRDVRFHEFKEFQPFKELERLANMGTKVRKTARRDRTYVVGIHVFVTGSIGGVHRHGENMISIISCQYAWPTIFILISLAWLNFWGLVDIYFTYYVGICRIMVVFLLHSKKFVLTPDVGTLVKALGDDLAYGDVQRGLTVDVPVIDIGAGVQELLHALQVALVC
ncbi:hypothetical protein RHSIM_Rhsim07G0166700 [Rhododendron simsii]|uniref:Uncharacterized protein n=1 Tax=Rhododendron simsii TaxID=118357 RepID=A0A834GRL6_RHOSS|nr:hypothetical protein RHSIM_Rhsim07G0166700 [Rhododendron simsii]